MGLGSKYLGKVTELFALRCFKCKERVTYTRTMVPTGWVCDDCIGTKHTFFATFGCGQPGYPGYLQVDVFGPFTFLGAEAQARRRLHDETDGRWSHLYTSITDLHKNDRILRGFV